MKEENKIKTFKEVYEDGSVLLYKKSRYVSNFLILNIIVFVSTYWFLSIIISFLVSLTVASVVVYKYKKYFGKYKISIEEDELYGIKFSWNLNTKIYLNPQKFVSKGNGKIEIVSFNESSDSIINPFPWFNLWYPIIYLFKINNN